MAIYKMQLALLSLARKVGLYLTISQWLLQQTPSLSQLMARLRSSLELVRVRGTTLLKGCSNSD